MKTIPEIVREFVTLYVPPVHQGAAERTMLLIVEAAKADAELAVVTAMAEQAGVASDKCQVHDDDDVVPGRICGRPLPCRDHASKTEPAPAPDGCE